MMSSERAKRIVKTTASVLLLFALLCSVSYAEEQQKHYSPFVELFRPGVFPDRVVLCVTEDLSTSQAVSWRTDDTVKTGVAQIIEAVPSPKFEDRVQTVPATTSEFKSDLWTVNYHSVIFKGLKPNTPYLYRVGDNTNWSEWFQFRTASDKPEPFSFLYFGDVQANILSGWSRVIREAFKAAPNAKFMAYAGDIANRATVDTEWGEFFRGGGWIFGMMPMMAAPGNHERHLDSEKKHSWITPHWRAQFVFPENSPEEHEEYAYYIDIQGLRMISLNSSYDHAKQSAWLEQVLSNNPNKWTAIIFHHPLHSPVKGRDPDWIRSGWQPIFDKYKVDLVMTGHEHTYARSKMLQSTVYVCSVSGPKTYEAEKKPWMARVADDTQFFQVITIDGDKLLYEARTATGSLYDSFELYKQPGQSNRIVDKIPADVPEHLTSTE